jgi:hypothetical protein
VGDRWQGEDGAVRRSGKGSTQRGGGRVVSGKGRGWVGPSSQGGAMTVGDPHSKTTNSNPPPPLLVKGRMTGGGPI